MDASGTTDGPLIDGLTGLCDAALPAAEGLLAETRQHLTDMVVVDGRAKGALVEKHQTEVHGLAWVATYVEGLHQMLEWGKRLDAEDRLGELEQLMVQAAFGEYLSQLEGGIAVSQLEIVRPGDIGIGEAEIATFRNDAVHTLQRHGNTGAVRQRIAELIEDGHFGAPGLSDETLDMGARPVPPLRGRSGRAARARMAPA